MEQLVNGFVASVSLLNLSVCFVGALIGTMVGVLPGLGPAATMAITLPFTLRFGPAAGIIMLTGIWYGAQYGGSTTSILVNIPGESSSVVTCFDGYQMAKKGRAGAALTTVALGSFIAGTIGIIGLQLFAPFLGGIVLSFGPPEYFAFLILAFILLSSLATQSPRKGLFMLGIGIFISCIGITDLDAVPRFTFGSDFLLGRIDFLPIAMGCFGIAEVLRISIETYVPPVLKKIRFRELYPNKEELRRSVAPILRGSVLGFFVGLLPGPAVVISTFLSYTVEKKLSKTPEKFGTGMIEGVAGPEAANNSAVIAALIALLTLGIPFGPPSAILLAALRMQNVEPGPMLFVNNPQIFWTFIASLYIGNFMLLILNLPLVGFFARIAVITPKVLMPIISILCLVGVYAVRNSFIDVWLMIVAGIVGYFFNVWQYPIAPLVIGLILGPMIENNLMQSLILFKGDLSLFTERPIAMAFLLVSVAYLLFKILYGVSQRGKKAPALAEE